MYVLYILGMQLEPALGRMRFATIYAVSLLTARSARCWSRRTRSRSAPRSGFRDHGRLRRRDALA